MAVFFYKGLHSCNIVYMWLNCTLNTKQTVSHVVVESVAKVVQYSIVHNFSYKRNHKGFVLFSSIEVKHM